jgi:hypothetical protein
MASQPSPPRWQDLLARYLQEEKRVAESGGGEVEVYQAQPALGLDVALAWPDALLPAALLRDSGLGNVAMPADWAQQARQTALAAAFPCCVGLAPQFLQQVSPLLHDAPAFFRAPIQLTRAGSSPMSIPEAYSRLACARILGDWATVEALLSEQEISQKPLLQQNERAAQAWLRGDRKEAETLWISLPGDQPVVAFNQGLAALARGDATTGCERLTRAKKGFPESSGWHHLAELYLVATRTK